MPDLTFLAIENPLGVLGPKVRGVVTRKQDLDPLKHVSKTTQDASKYALSSNNKYAYRAANLPEGVARLMVDDTIGNRDYVLKLLSARRHPNLRVSMASSLNSLMKYMAAYGLANVADRFETLIVYGHGLPGSVNLGLGKIGIGQPKPYGHKRYEARKNIREVFGLDKRSQGEMPEPNRIRDLNTKNLDLWTGAFASIQPYVDLAPTGYFHLFLMGCSVGDEKVSKRGDITTLQGAAASTLSAVLQQPVCISAPSRTIDDDHLDDLLNRMDAIRTACAAGEKVFLKGGDEPVPLMSACAD